MRLELTSIHRQNSWALRSEKIGQNNGQVDGLENQAIEPFG